MRQEAFNPSCSSRNISFLCLTNKHFLRKTMQQKMNSYKAFSAKIHCSASYCKTLVKMKYFLWYLSFVDFATIHAGKTFHPSSEITLSLASSPKTINPHLDNRSYGDLSTLSIEPTNQKVQKRSCQKGNYNLISHHFIW